MKILFVCAYNRFRSKCAEALFNKYSKNPENEAKSAGARIDLMHQFMAKSAIDELKKRGARANNEPAQQMTDELIDWADKIILVADNVEPSLFPKEKTEVWPVHDASEHDLPAVKDRIDDIEKRVKKFVSSLKNS